MGTSRYNTPWKWPLCISLAFFLVLLLCFTTPQSWLDALFSPSLPYSYRAESVRPPEVMSIMPVPVIEIDSEPETKEDKDHDRKTPETWRPEPAWWQAAWQIRFQDETRHLFTPEIEDSTDIAWFGSESMTTVLRDASVDTSYNNRLVLYQMRLYDHIEQFKPAWLGVARSRLYRELMNQSARLFDEFLLEEISIPNPDSQTARP